MYARALYSGSTVARAQKQHEYESIALRRKLSDNKSPLPWH